MSRSIRFSIMAMSLVAALCAAQIVVAVAPSGRSPYLSALSDLTTQTALASNACNEETCAKEPGRGPQCVKSGPGVTCLVKSGCFSSTCS
jgi:N-acetylmuramic acid 6-phosphate (MurNAc-6-P) etherase